MANQIVVIDASAAGMGAAGAAKQGDPDASVIVFTELGDGAYSPCGVPYVHGWAIDNFDRLPWTLRRAIILSRPGSHRQGWPPPTLSG